MHSLNAKNNRRLNKGEMQMIIKRIKQVISDNVENFKSYWYVLLSFVALGSMSRNSDMLHVILVAIPAWMAVAATLRLNHDVSLRAARKSSQ